MADDAVVGLAERRERQRVGGGAVEDEEHLAVDFKEVAEQVGSLGGPGVVAVAGRVAVVGSLGRLPSFGTDPRVVVARELPEPRGRWRNHLAPMLR